MEKTRNSVSPHKLEGLRKIEDSSDSLIGTHSGVQYYCKRSKLHVSAIFEAAMPPAPLPPDSVNEEQRYSILYGTPQAQPTEPIHHDNGACVRPATARACVQRSYLPFHMLESRMMSVSGAP
jgi:hypothetical protein